MVRKTPLSIKVCIDQENHWANQT